MNPISTGGGRGIFHVNEFSASESQNGKSHSLETWLLFSNKYQQYFECYKLEIDFPCCHGNQFVKSRSPVENEQNQKSVIKN